MTGKLIISLDFELMWGVRDHMSAAAYGDAILGGRKAIPKMLRMFEEHGIRATWATVGLLFARSKREMLEHMPDVLPEYVNAELGNYAAVRTDVGENEEDDPLHFGRSLLDRIAQVPGQEIATHTFAHYYCLEDGQSLEAFEADLDASLSIAAAAGHELRSIVFPRNQFTDAHIKACADRRITAFRGQPAGFAYRTMAGREVTPLVRGTRLLDSVMPVLSRTDPKDPAQRAGGYDVTASRFLRPWRKDWPGFSTLHVRRICAEMKRAAREGRQFHLWWHPHNFGRNTEQNLAQLKRILTAYDRLKDEHGMLSCGMRDVLPDAGSGRVAP